jgi:hypothetical protein
MVDVLTSIHGRKLGLDANGNLVIGDGGIITNNNSTPMGVGLSGTVAAGSTKTLTSADSGKRVLLDTATGSVVTLPAATGSGVRFPFVVTVIATSNSHVIKVANASDFMIGVIQGVSDDPATMKGWIAANSGTVATNSDTVTLNRGTTGSVTKGEYVTLTDIAANTWLVEGVITQTGAEATPFSATV